MPSFSSNFMKEGNAAQLEIGLLNNNRRENIPLQLWVPCISDHLLCLILWAARSSQCLIDVLHASTGSVCKELIPKVGG